MSIEKSAAKFIYQNRSKRFGASSSSAVILDIDLTESSVNRSIGNAMAKKTETFSAIAKTMRGRMTPDNFTAWLAHMYATRKWSGRECARQLGCGSNSIGVWRKKGAPPYIGLACAALAMGVPSWRSVA